VALIVDHLRASQRLTSAEFIFQHPAFRYVSALVSPPPFLIFAITYSKRHSVYIEYVRIMDSTSGKIEEYRAIRRTAVTH
jgi:hypothetical protein